ncbi:MAG: prolyl endopeptidase [Flavobacteriales bacterium]|nr:MAG: prolyl endopeptidase [Flavobacteriales bacterium]
MKFRVARHTSKIDTIINFYHSILGFDILGSFENHDGYDGVFLGLKDENWHLEFTISEVSPNHHPDEDDLLVFYANSENHYTELITSLKNNNIVEVQPKNSYWKKNGITFLDPDGFRIVISRKA